MIDFPDDQGFTEISSFVNTAEGQQDEDGIVVLGKGRKENIEFEWKIEPWSTCSETCGGDGYQTRTATCIVR